MSTLPRSAPSRGFQALIGEDRWRDLLAGGRDRQTAGKSLLIDQGDRRRILYAIRSGRVRVAYVGSEGSETFIAVRGPGDLIGEYAQQDARGRTASVWTLEPCSVVELGFEYFGTFIDGSGLGEALQRYMLSKTRQNPRRIHWAGIRSTEQRMAEVFLEVVRAGRGPDLMQVHMDQYLIAEVLGVSRNWVNRVLRTWREEGFIEVRRGLVTVLDLDALKQHAAVDMEWHDSPPLV